MTAEIVSALNNLTTVNKELASKRQAEADKESQDRKDERVKLQKIIDNGKKSESDRNEAKEELRKLNKKEDLAKEVSTEIFFLAYLFLIKLYIIIPTLTIEIISIKSTPYKNQSIIGCTLDTIPASNMISAFHTICGI